MILRFLTFVVVAVIGYVGTVIGAFVFWDITGASGPDYTPLLFVLFGLAPVAAVTLGVLVLRRRHKPAAPPPEAGRERGPYSGQPVATARRNGPVQWAVVIVGMAIAAAFALWMGPGNVPYIPRFSP